jgi:EmrB/QacA subfamily drug resistance transporter
MDARVEPSAQKPLTHGEARLLIIGMLLPVFMGSLDNTILASALPTIGREFGDTRNLPWLISVYLLASTAVVPLYGKIADIHGRRFTLRIALIAYMAGSLVCALAPNMLVLILGRALHGLGGGGLASMGSVVLGDVAAPKERGRYYAYFAVVYTTAGASGPALGGFLSDYIHWSAIFWLNIPLGLAAMTITLSLLRRLPRHERPHRLDVLGALLIVVASVSFMLGLNLTGVRYSWTSPPVLALFAAAAVVGAGFVWRLLTAPEPLIPISILRNPSVVCCVVAHAFGWGSILGLNIFLPMYLQNVIGLTPTNAGLTLMVLMIALNVSAGISGYVLMRQRRYKLLPLTSCLIAIASILTLAWRVDSLDLVSFEFLLFMIGLGFGPMPGLAQTALQNSVPRHQLGISVGTMNFCRSLLGTMLVAVFGAIVAAGTLPIAPGELAPGTLGGTLEHNAALAAEAFRRVFYAAAAALAVAFVAVLLLEEKPLQTAAVADAK